MKVVVFGATGTAGREIVAQALIEGHEVTAFVRDPAKMTVEDKMGSAKDRLTALTGDIFDYSAVKQAVQGQEAVICSLGSSSLTKTNVRGEGTANIVKAMEEENVDRLVVVSAMGTGESWSALSFTNKLFYATLLRASRQDHEAQEAVVKESTLSWTIIRPSGLTDDEPTGDYAIAENIQGESSKIPAADVAHAIIKELDGNAFVRMAVTVTN